MASTTIRELLVRIGVTEGDSAKAIAKIDDAMGSLVDVATKVVAGVAAVSAALGALVLSAASAADNVDKGAQAAAISTDAYQELAFVATQAGTDIELLSKALGKQTTALGQMEAGTGTANDAMTALGLTLADLVGLSPDEQFARTATAIAAQADEQKRLQAATAIYGEEMAQRLMPLLAMGGAGIANLRAEARDLGFVLGEEGVAAGVKFTDTLDKTWKLLGAIKNRIGLELAPIFTDMLQRFLDWYEANSDIINQRIDKAVDLVTIAIEQLEIQGRRVDKFVREQLGGWDVVFAGVAAAVTGVGTAITGLGLLKVLLAIQSILEGIGIAGAASFGWLAVAVAAVVATFAGWLLVLDDLYTYLEGGDSIIGRFVERFQEADGILGAVARQIPVIVDFLSALWDVVSKIGAIVAHVFGEVWGPAMDIVGQSIMALVSGPLEILRFMIEEVIKPSLLWLTGALGVVSADLSAAGTALGADVGPGPAGVTAPTGYTYIPGSANAAFAPPAPASPGASSKSTTVQVAGSSLTVNGAGITAEEAQALYEAMMAEQARQTAAALDGAAA